MCVIAAEGCGAIRCGAQESSRARDGGETGVTIGQSDLLHGADARDTGTAWKPSGRNDLFVPAASANDPIGRAGSYGRPVTLKVKNSSAGLHSLSLM